MKNIHHLLITGLIGGMPLSAHAVETSSPIIVTATRTAQTADDTLAPVIVITRSEIENSTASDIADLLRMHAGLDIARNGGPGQTATLFLRGTESNHTLVMIDGVKINPGTIGGPAFNHIDPALIEHIEIVKGPRSTLYGSEAIGGVINIITRKTVEQASGDFSYLRGSFGTHQEMAGVHTAKDNIRTGVSLSNYKTDGFSPLAASSLERGHHKTSVNAYAGVKVKNIDAELSLWQASGNTEYLDSFSLAALDQDFQNRSGAIKLETPVTDNWFSMLRLSRLVDEIDQNQGSDFVHTRRDVIDWQNDIQAGAQQLVSVGIQVSRENVAASVWGTGFDEVTRTNAVYIQDDIQAGAHHVLAAARYTDHEDFGGHTSWDIEYGYVLSQQTRLTAAVGTGFRAPDHTDRFGFGGDPNLDPETSRSIELGLRHRYSPQQSVSLSAFDTRIEDLIDWDGGSSSMKNIGEASIRGVEAGYELQLDGFGMRLNAIVQDPRDEENDQVLPRRAKRSLTAAVHYQAGALRVGADAIAQSERKDSFFSSAENAGYAILNLHARYQLHPELYLMARVENAFDREYVLADGYNTAERSFYVTLGYQPGR